MEGPLLEKVKELNEAQTWALVEELEYLADRHGGLFMVEKEYFWMPTHRNVQ